MGIRIMKDVKIACDQCGMELARLKASKEVVDALDKDSGNGVPEGERYAKMECTFCVQNPGGVTEIIVEKIVDDWSTEDKEKLVKALQERIASEHEDARR